MKDNSKLYEEKYAKKNQLSFTDDPDIGIITSHVDIIDEKR